MLDSHVQPPQPRPATSPQESSKDMSSVERKPGGNARPQRRQKFTPEELVATLRARRVRANRIPPATFSEALSVSAQRDEIA